MEAWNATAIRSRVLHEVLDVSLHLDGLKVRPLPHDSGHKLEPATMRGSSWELL